MSINDSFQTQKNSNLTLSTTELVDIYKKAQSCENEIRNASRNSISTYSSLLLGIIGGGLAIVRYILEMKVLVVFLLFCIGASLISLSYIAYHSFESDFRRQVEYMSIQGKLEDILGLTDPNLFHANQYWTTEPIIPMSYILFRSEPKNSKSSLQFVNNLVRKKTNHMIAYYGMFFVIGVCFFIVALLILLNIIDLGIITDL